MVGAVLSSFIFTVSLALLPMRSDAVAVLKFGFPAPSAVTLAIAGEGPLPMPDPESVAVQVILTSALFHPELLGVCERVAVRVGSVLSRVYDAATVEEPAPVQLLPWEFGNA